MKPWLLEATVCACVQGVVSVCCEPDGGELSSLEGAGLVHITYPDNSHEVSTNQRLAYGRNGLKCVANQATREERQNLGFAKHQRMFSAIGRSSKPTCRASDL